MIKYCFDGLRCSSTGCVGDKCVCKELQAVTQHTETATPNQPYGFEYAMATMSSEHQELVRSYIDKLKSNLDAARLELSAERDAVAQYIGERNGLQGKLKEANNCIDGLGVNLRAAHKHGDTLRTQLADLRQHYNDTLMRANSAEVRELEVRVQLAQAQNEAYQRGQNDQAKHDGPIVNAAYRDGRNKALDEVLQGCARDLTDMMLESFNLMDVGLQDAAWAHRIRADQECVRYNIVLALKSPNSAEGEPG